LTKPPGRASACRTQHGWRSSADARSRPDRGAGAFPVLVTPGYPASARSRLGDDTTLAVEQLVVVETDPQRARAIARGPLGFLGKIPAYQASFRRMGFTGLDLAP
jgi:hypothetical protein